MEWGRLLHRVERGPLPEGRKRTHSLSLWCGVQHDVLEAIVRTAGGLEVACALPDDRQSVSIGAGVGVIENHNAAGGHGSVMYGELTVRIVSRRIAAVPLDCPEPARGPDGSGVALIALRTH